MRKLALEDDIEELSELGEEKEVRKPKFRHNRLNLGEHFEMCHATNGFQSRYHMTSNAFERLVGLLDITVNEDRSRASTQGNDPICSRMIVAMGLRFMGGEKKKSLADIFGCSISSVDRIVDIFLNAVDLCSHVDLSVDLLPTEYNEQVRMAIDWNEKSGALGIYYGCIGAIDGWLCTMEKPADVINPTDYHSGHYQRFGMNVQAMCDVNLRFIYLSVCASGGTGDARAFRKLHGLNAWLDGLREGFYIIGDCAYELTNKLLIPFSGARRLDEANDNYNFFLSQLRIRIEMTFGRLTTKWRIFRSDLLAANGTARNCLIIRVGAKLHNYVINIDNPNLKSVPVDDFESLEIEPLEDGPEGNLGFLPIVSDVNDISRLSINAEDRRTLIVDTLREYPELKRPSRD